MSRIPTEWPARERERASWVVIEDLPTPPLPERTRGFVRMTGREREVGRKGRNLRAQCA